MTRMQTAGKALGVCTVMACGVARAQFLSDLKQPERSGRDFVLHLGAVYVYDTNVYLDEDSVVADSVCRGLASFTYESETPSRFFRLGYDFAYPWYLEETELIEPEHRIVLLYDQSNGWGELVLSDEFKSASDPVNVEDPVVPYPKGKMIRVGNKLDPRVRFDLRALDLEVGGVWQFSDYSPSELNYLDYEDLTFHCEAIVKAGSRNEFFVHYGIGDLEYPHIGGAGVDYRHSTVYCGLRGQPSPKIAYEVAAGFLGLDPETGDDESELYASARGTWEPTPGINRVAVSFIRDARPSGVSPYAFANKGELSYGHWLRSRFHVEAGASFESGETPGGGGDWETLGGFGGLRYEFQNFRYLFVRYERRVRDAELDSASYVDGRLSSGLVFRF